MRELEPLLNKRVTLPVLVASAVRVPLDLGPGWGIVVKQLDMMLNDRTGATGETAQGLSDDPDMPIPVLTTDWVSDERVRIQRMMRVELSAGGVGMLNNIHEYYKVPDRGLVLVHDYQLLQRTFAGLQVLSAFTIWYKVVEFDLDEWVFHMQQILTEGT